MLVVDNCEHVLEPARRVCGLLAGRAADLRVLATSRISLDIDPECVWRVQPMAVPGEAGPPVATEAVTLFLARAAMAGVTVALAYADRHLVPASSTGWTVSNISGPVVNAAVLVVGLVLASRRPDNRIGWLFLAAGLALGLSGFSDQYALHALVADPGSWPAGRAAAWLFNVIWVIPVAMLAFVLLLFPTGHVRSRRWRLAGWFIAGVFTLATLWALIVAIRLWALPFTSPFTQAGSPAGAPALFLMTAVLISAALLVS